MAVGTAAYKVFLPRYTCFFHPPEPFAHALSQNNLHFIDRVTFAPQIDDLGHAQFAEQLFEIYFMQNTLDIRQTNLKRVMVMHGIKPICNLFRQQPFAVVLLDFDVHVLFNSRIGANRQIGTVVFHGDRLYIPNSIGRIRNDYYMPIGKQGWVLTAYPAGEH